MSKKDFDKAKKFKEASLQLFKLPDNFEERVKILEEELDNCDFGYSKLDELLGLYSKAAQHYDSINKMEKFIYFLNKINKIESHDKAKFLLEKKQSKDLFQSIKLNMEEKMEQVNKIKSLVKQSEKTNIEDTNHIIEEYTIKNSNSDNFLNKEIDNQKENFKKRLEMKRMLRIKSTPMMLSFKNKLNTRCELTLIEEKKIKTPKQHSLYNLGDSVKKRNSAFNFKFHSNNFENNDTFRKLKTNGAINQNIKKINPKDVLNEIFKDYNEKLETNLKGVLLKAEINLIEKINFFEDKMKNFIDDITNEKMKKILEVNEKFDKEMKEIEFDVDFNDETNINTIIFNQLKDEKLKEIKNVNEEIEIRKKEGINELKSDSRRLITGFDKAKDLQDMKYGLSETIKSKIGKMIKDAKDSLNYNRKPERKSIFNELNKNCYAPNGHLKK